MIAAARCFRGGLLPAAAALCLACGDEPARGPEPLEAVESVVRLDFEGGARGEVEAGGETRLAQVVAAPATLELCHPAAPEGVARSLVVGASSEAPGTSLRLGAGPESRKAEPAEAWSDLRLPVGSAAGCVEVAVEAPPGGRAALSVPRLERRGRPRPWVVLYVVDTLRFDATPWGGADSEVAPAFERFARAAILYRRALTVTSWTRPSVATLLTGLGPSHHGVSDRQDRLPAGLPRLPERLAAAGWATVAVSTNPNILPLWGFLPGFDRFLDLEAEGWTQRQGLARLGSTVDSLLDAHATAPLFLYVHDNGPHAPWAPPAPARARFGAPSAGHPAEAPGSAEDPPEMREARQRLYRASIRDTSDRFAALIEKLRALGRYDDALIVLVADHGEEFGDHGDVSHGRTLYQEQLHVPLVVKLPGAAGASGVVETPVSLEDVAPTILAELGLEGAEGGRRLPVPGQPSEAGVAVFAELDLDGRRAETVVAWPWKYLQQGGQADRLFDLERDPGETRDAAAEAPEVLERLRAVSAVRRTAARSGLWLECVAGARRAKLALTLLLEGVGAPEAVGLEPEDRVVGGAGGQAVHLDLRPPGKFSAAERLHPRLAARGQPDRDRIRWSAPAASELGLRSTGAAVQLVSPVGELLPTDGTPIPAGALTTVTIPPPLPAGGLPRCRLYRLEPRHETVPEERVDDGVRERLRALGYLEDGP